MKAYIGITGFMWHGQVESLLDAVELSSWPEDRQLMVGVLVSYKSLHGQWAVDPSNPKQFPLVPLADQIFIDHPRLLNLVHFNSRKGSLANQLRRIFGLVPAAHGVQLNIAWPPFVALHTFRREHPEKVIVLQVSRDAYRQAGGTPDGLVRALTLYQGLADAVLFDPSGGVGREFDLDQAASILEALVTSDLQLRWGIAGGLGPGRLSRKLQPLLEIYPDLSWDAQGKLRDADDNLDLHACRNYLQGSLATLQFTAASGN